MKQIDVTVLYKQALLKANLCVRCHVNPLARNTQHCENCLDKRNRMYIPKNNGKGRKIVPRMAA